MVRERSQSSREINEFQRYSRQERLWGQEGQERINNSVVTIVGSDNGAKNLAMPLAALGIGELRVVGRKATSRGERFLDMPMRPGRFRAHEITKAMRPINPNVVGVPLEMDLEERCAATLALEGSSVIVDTTNNPRSKAVVIDYAKRHRIPVLTSGIGPSMGSFELLDFSHRMPNLREAQLMPHYEGLEQGDLMSKLFGGLMWEEIKKILIEDREHLMRAPVYVTRGIGNRFHHRGDGPIIRFTDEDKRKYRGLKALLVGAGALGNAILEPLVDMGVGSVDILDDDGVEDHNLNRQVLFYDAIGEKKAEVLAEKYGIMGRADNLLSRAYVKRFELSNRRFTPELLRPEGYDVVFTLVDNLYARALISAYCVKTSTTLISAGSSPKGAQQETYVPGQTSCLNHIRPGFYESGIREEHRRRQSCIDHADGSVIGTNLVGGTLAAFALQDVVQPDKFDQPHNGKLEYKTEIDPRLSEMKMANPCDCHEHPERLPLDKLEFPPEEGVRN